MKSDPAELGAAVLAAVRGNASVVKEHRQHVDFNAWWRGGDSPSVRLYPARATWVDCVTMDKGGAKDFARTAFNMDLRDFMQRWGDPSKRPPPAPPVPELKTIWTDGEAERVWHDLPHESWFVSGWRQSRGWPLLSASNRYLPARAVRVFSINAHWPVGVVKQDGTTLTQWMDRNIKGHGPCVVLALRSARTGRVESLVVRKTDPRPGDLKSMTLPMCKIADSDGIPRGYGDADLMWRAPLSFLFEGGPDTLAGMITLGHDAVCAGAVSAGVLQQWAPVIGHRGPVWIVPHLDKDSTKKEGAGFVGQRASADLAERVIKAGRVARVFPWGSYLDHLRGVGVDTAKITDFSDAVKACTDAGWTGQQTAQAVMGVLK